MIKLHYCQNCPAALKEGFFFTLNDGTEAKHCSYQCHRRTVYVRELREHEEARPAYRWVERNGEVAGHYEELKGTVDVQLTAYPELDVFLWCDEDYDWHLFERSTGLRLSNRGGAWDRAIKGSLENISKARAGVIASHIYDAIDRHGVSPAVKKGAAA